MLIPESQQNDILIYAFRYALERKTHSAYTIQRLIKKGWDELPPHDRKQIQKEIREANDSGKLGMGFNKVGWLEILELNDRWKIKITNT